MSEIDVENRASRLNRLTLGLIGGVAALHSAVAVAQPEWRDIVRGGLWNTVQEDDDATMSTMWFTIAGGGLVAIGVLAARAVRDTGSLPPQVAALLVGIGVPIAVLQPKSGGWLVIATGGVAHAATRAAGAGAR